jgi:hypothetical protein
VRGVRKAGDLFGGVGGGGRCGVDEGEGGEEEEGEEGDEMGGGWHHSVGGWAGKEQRGLEDREDLNGIRFVLFRWTCWIVGSWTR